MHNFKTFIWKFFKEEKFILLIPIIFASILAIYETLTPWVLKLIIDEINAPLSTKSTGYIIKLAISYILLTEIANLMFRAKDIFKLKAFPQIKSKLLMYTYWNVIHHSYTFFQDRYSGDIVNKISNLTQGIENLVKMIIDMFLWRSFSLLIASCTMALINPYFSVIILIWSISFIYSTYIFSIKCHKDVKRFSHSRGKLFGKIHDSISNILNILLFNKHEHEYSKLSSALNTHIAKEKIILKNIVKIGFFQGISVTIFSAIIILLLCYLKLNNLISIGDFTFIIFISGSIIRNIYSISTDLVQFSRELGIFVQSYDDIINPNLSCFHQSKSEYNSSFKGHIEFKNVTFGYTDRQPILKNLNLIIQPNEKIGIVGSSGSGKTTFINLLTKVFDTYSGEILIDKKNINTISAATLTDYISCVPQNPILFNRSILDNILFGAPTSNHDKVIEICKACMIHNFIESLPNKYHTIVGERGVKLSGGEKQRIVLARAFLKKSPILILDEATSALDNFTEKEIQNSIQKLIHNTTAIIIAHRLSTLKNMDRILVFKDGAIIESGSHQQLLQQNNEYTKLWRLHNNQEKQLEHPPLD